MITTTPKRMIWRGHSVQPQGALAITFDLVPEDLTPAQLEALQALRAAFFLFDRDTPRT